MTELNLDKFSYQRKRSVFNQGASDAVAGAAAHESCASTSDARNYSSHLDLDSRDQENSKHALEEKVEPLHNGDWPVQFAELVEILPSETRLQLVDAITSASSMEEAVNSVCNNLASNSGK